MKSPLKFSPTSWLKSTLKKARKKASPLKKAEKEINVLSEFEKYIDQSIKYINGKDTVTHFDRMVIYEKHFATLLRMYKKDYTPECQSIIVSWMGTTGQKMGQRDFKTETTSYTIRPALYFKEHEHHKKGKEDFQELNLCAHTIDPGQKLLFRGLSREFEFGSIEKLTATTLSLGVTNYYEGPLVILYVPNQKVHGLVVNNFDGYSRGSNNDSEVLLVSPHVKLIDDEETVKKMMALQMSQVDKHDDLQRLLRDRKIIMYEYLGYFPTALERYDDPTGLQRYDDEYFYKKDGDILQFSVLENLYFDPFEYGQHPQSVSA